MAASKPRTTMAKLNRERKLVERRHLKQAKKAARKQAAADESAQAEDSVGTEAAPEGEVEAVASQQVAATAAE